MPDRPGLGQNAQPAAFGHPGARQPHRNHFDLTRYGVVSGLLAAAIGHVDDVDAGLQLEHLDRNVQRAADAVRAVVQLARPGLGVGDEFRQCLRRQLRIDRENRPRGGDQGYRRYVLGRVVRIVPFLERQHREFGGTDHQGEAVGVGADQVLSADLSHGAGAVVDHDRLTEAGTHLLRIEPAEHVDQRARRRGDDEMDRARPIIVCGGAAGCDGQHEQSGNAKRCDCVAARHAALLAGIDHQMSVIKGRRLINDYRPSISATSYALRQNPGHAGVRS